MLQRYVLLQMKVAIQMIKNFKKISYEIDTFFEELWKKHEPNKHSMPNLHGIKVHLYRALMGEPKYKLGDKVKIIKELALNIPTGLEGIVVDIDKVIAGWDRSEKISIHWYEVFIIENVNNLKLDDKLNYKINALEDEIEILGEQ